MFANKYVKSLKPYPVSSHKAWEIKDKSSILKLDWNEATISPSPRVKENIIKFLDNGKINWYPDTNNINLLKEISKYNMVPLENLQYFASSDALHEYIMRVFVEPNDKITIVAPTYDNFRAVVESNGAVVDFYYLDDKFELDFENFKQHLILNTPKIVYICNPNNPTGTLYDKEDIENLVINFPSTMFVVDEAYFEFDGISCKELALKYENILISRTFSKAFALASFRIGYAITNKTNIELLSKIRNPKNITSFSQIAAISVLEDIDYVKKYVNEVKKAKEYFKRELSDLKLNFICHKNGGGGNFLLIELEYLKKQKMIEFLLNKNIFVRDYSHVKNMENYFRITIGTIEQMEKVVLAIREFLNVK